MKTVLGASIIIAGLAISDGRPNLNAQNDTRTTAMVPQRLGYGPIPFTSRVVPAGVTLAQEISNVQRLQEQLRSATDEYERTYRAGIANIKEEYRRTMNPGVRQAQQALLRTLAHDHQTALRRVRTASEHMSAALAQAQDAMNSQNTLRLTEDLDQSQHRFDQLTRRANDAAGFLNDHTRRVRKAMIANATRRTS